MFAALVGCEKPDAGLTGGDGENQGKPLPEKVEITPKTHEFKAETELTCVVKVESSADWTLTPESASWLTPSETSGKNGATVTFTAKPNTTNEKRGPVTFTFKVGKATATFKAEQLGKASPEPEPQPKDILEFKNPADANLVVSSEEMLFKNFALNCTLPLDYLMADVEYISGGRGWIEAKDRFASYNLVLTVEKNEGPERKARVIIKSKVSGMVDDLVMNITQKAPEVVEPEPEPEPLPGDFVGKTVWVKGLNNIPDPKGWKCLETVPAKRYGLKWDASYGWYDCNKIYPNGLNYGPILPGLEGKSDVNLCWAATASNMIYWWLDINKDNIARYGKYTGPKEYKDSFHAEVFDLFKNNFEDTGYDVNAVLNWFFTGRTIGVGGVSADKAGFFKDVLGEGEVASELFACDGGRFTQVVKDALAAGKVIGINHTFTNRSLHAINLWGATFDEKGEITHIYVTDSNNGYYVGQQEGEILTPAGLEKRAVMVIDGDTCMESSSPGKFSLPITSLYTISPMTDKWEAYFAK